MEEFFEIESVLCLGRNDAEEESRFRYNLLEVKEANNAGNNAWLLEETVSRGCEEEMKWFDSLLVEEEKLRITAHMSLQNCLKKKHQRLQQKKKTEIAKRGRWRSPKLS